MPPDPRTTTEAQWLSPQGPREGLGHYVRVARERIWLIVACVVVALAVAALYTQLVSPTWKATSDLLVTPVNSEANVAGLGLITNSGTTAGATSTAASLVTTPEVADAVASKLPHTTSGALLEEVSAVPVAESNIVAVTATSSSAKRAQAVANEFARQTVEYQTAQLHHRLEEILPVLQRQIEQAPATQRSGAGSLGERYAALATLRTAPNPNFAVASLATLPTSPASPRKKLSIVVGGLVGLVIGLAIAFVQDGLDPRVRREDEIRSIFRLPILARIPRERHLSARTSPLRPDQVSAMAVESYRMLYVALRGRSRGEEREEHVSHSLMITGSTSSEGKSTVSLNLAWAIAQAGKSVVIIEADVRRPSLQATLGVRPAHGISDVLVNDMPLEDALTTIPGTEDRLRVLLVNGAGQHLADGLLAAGGELISQARQCADYVIIDAPPITEVSDAVPLSQQVDDVIVVVRTGRSRSDRLVDLGEILMRYGVRPLGVVVVGDQSHMKSSYYGASKRRMPGHGSVDRHSRPPALTR